MKILSPYDNITIDVKMNRQLLTLTTDNILEQFDEELDLTINNSDLVDYFAYHGMHVAHEDEIKDIFLNLLQAHFAYYDPDDYVVSATLKLAFYIDHGEGYIDDDECYVHNIKIQKFHK